MDVKIRNLSRSLGLSDAETKLLAQRFEKKDDEKDKNALIAANSNNLGAASFLAPGFYSMCLYIYVKREW